MITYTLVQSSEAHWTDVFVHKDDGPGVKILVLKANGDESLLEGVSFPAVTSSFVRSDSNPVTLPASHLQVF